MRPLPVATLGIFCAVGASLAFSINDMGIKLLSGDYPLPQVVFTRSCIALVLTLSIIVPLEGGLANLKTRRPFMHALRGMVVLVANMSFFLGLAALDLPEATAIFFISPLVITVFSVLFLKETVGPWRWGAVVAGLAGVIIMLRPGADAFKVAALLPVLAAVCYATLHMLTRKIGGTEKASTMAVYIQLMFVCAMGAMGYAFGDGRFAGTGNVSLDFLLRGWVWPPREDFAVMALIGTMSAMGGYLISQAYRISQAATIAPFEYVSMVMAIVFGVTVFGVWPDIISWAGITLIIGAGLLVLWRENTRKVEIVLKPVPRRR